LSHNKLSRHELKEDNFVTFILEAREYLRENQNKFFAGLIVLIVVVAGAIWMNSSRMQARESAEAQFSEALSSYGAGQIKTAEEMFKIIDDRFSNVEQGVNSLYFLGKIALADGRYTEATTYFEEYISNSSKYPFFRDPAREGLAVSYENARNYVKASEIYLELSEDLTSNKFMGETYLERAAENLQLANQRTKAIEVLEKLVAITSGEKRRKLEIQLDLLRG
jgi:tetratricopeptide (TPR) repeat protein